MSLRSLALDYARQGYPVFPLAPRAKHPLTRRGLLNASTDLGQVARWWTFHPDANIGCVPGPSGHVVLDIDGAEGEATAAALDLPATREVRTGRGRHLWYRYDGPPVANGKLGAGIDVRGHNGYVLLPPSIHPNGQVYAWAGGEAVPLPAYVAVHLNRATGQAWAPEPASERQAVALVRLLHEPIWTEQERVELRNLAERNPTRAGLRTLLGELELEARTRRAKAAA